MQYRYLNTHSGLKVRVCDCHYKLVSKLNWYPFTADRPGHGDKIRFKAINKGRFPGQPNEILIHRLIAGFPPYGVDHDDGDPTHNECSNLRPSNQTQNNFNQKGPKYNSKSGYKGVYWHKAAQKWAAECVYNHKKHYLGLFEDVKDAARAYNAKALELDPDFAYLNVID